ncbi:MAG: response regulator [Desulfobacterales bacterium]|nr:response regulator [Desulfobacterales bacterium]
MKPTYEELESRLARSEAVIDAIRSGDIDAVIGQKDVAIVYLKESVREARSALQSSRDNFQTLFNNIDDLVFVLSKDFRIITYNQSALNQLSYLPDELHGKNFFEIHIHDLSDEFKLKFEEITHQNPLIYAIPLLTKDEKVIFVETKVTHGNLDDREVYFCISRDISERIQAEQTLQNQKILVENANTELLRINTELESAIMKANSMAFEAEIANAAKSRFVAHVSHELRTPLNGILGYTQILMLDKSLSDSQKTGIKTIHRSGELLLSIINDILDISKIEADKMSLEISDFYFLGFLNDIVMNIKGRLQNKKIIFITEFAPDIPDYIKGDQKRLTQVLLNLLGNAVKFVKQGKIIFNVSRNGHFIRFSVEDTGYGIPKDRLNDIFLPFVQIPNHQGEIKGTGLGLSISSKLVELMGGKLNVVSSEGIGSVFWFEIALEQSELKISKITFEYKNIIGYQGRPIKILIVDDIQENRSILKELLLPLGFEIQEAVSGREAVNSAEIFIPDLIIMDLIMPEMDGFIATKKIKDNPLTRKTPIIALSASVSEKIIMLCKAAGCDDFVSKPVNMDILLSRIKNFLNLSWVYKSDNTYMNMSLPDYFDLDSQYVFPDEQDMNELNRLAMEGDIKGILNWTHKIQSKYSGCDEFTRKIIFLADQFKINEIENILVEYKKNLII